MTQNNKNCLISSIMALISATISIIAASLIVSAMPAMHSIIPHIDIIAIYIMTIVMGNIPNPIFLLLLGIIYDLCSGTIIGISSACSIVITSNVTINENRPIDAFKLTVGILSTKWILTCILSNAIISPKTIIYSLISTTISCYFLCHCVAAFLARSKRKFDFN